MATLQERYDSGTIATQSGVADMVLLETQKITQWAADVVYQQNQVVYATTGSGGHNFMSLVNNNVGNPVTDTTKWQDLGVGGLNQTNVGKAMRFKDLAEQVVAKNAALTAVTDGGNADAQHVHSLDAISEKNDIMLKSVYATNTSGTPMVDMAATVDVPSGAASGDVYVVSTDGTANFEHRGFVPDGSVDGQVLSNVNGVVQWANKTTVYDGLDSTNGTMALSANQGRVLANRVATTTTLGNIKPDGTTIIVEQDGTTRAAVAAVAAGAQLNISCPHIADDATLTLTKGGDTKTATVTSGMAYFYNIPFGTWTLSSGTFSRPIAVTEAKVYDIPLVRIYAYMIAQADSNPGTRVSYPKTVSVGGVTYPVENFGFDPIRNIANVGVVYGDWKGDEFFWPKPCMVTYAGEVDYYLDPANYAYAIDGTASDVGNIDYGGNAMIQFPKAWVLRRKDTIDGKVYEVFIMAEDKLSNDFHAFAHKDAVDGTLRDYMYQSIYTCTTDGSSRMRSISGQTITTTLAGATANADLYATGVTNSMIGRAIANNTEGSLAPGRWFSRTWAQWCYMQDLVILLTKSTDGQGTIGRGNCGDGSSGTAITTTGATNAWGMFGGITTSNATQMKALGIEDFWGNHAKWAIGRSLVGGVNIVKMCVDGEDGSTAGVYAFDGTGGVNTGQGRLGTTNAWYYPAVYAFGEQGRYGTSTSGSPAPGTSTYCCDGEYYGTATASTAVVGGNYSDGLSDGPVCAHLNVPLSYSSAHVAFALSLV